MSCRRRIIAAAQGGAYQRCEFIRSTGTQYLDLGFKPTSKTRIIIDWKINALGRFFGANDNENNFRATYSSGSPNSYGIYWGSQNAYVSFGSFGVRHTLEIGYNKVNEANEVYISNELKHTFDDEVFESQQEFGLFNFLPANAGTYVSAEFYGMRAYEDGVLIRDLDARYRRSDGVAGAYDRVNGIFYENQGTGNFIKGGDL